MDKEDFPELGDLPVEIRIDNIDINSDFNLPKDEIVEFFESKWRGRILTASVFVEGILDGAILSSFFSENHNKKSAEFFYHNFLKQGFTTFENKKKFLVNFAKNQGFYDDLVGDNFSVADFFKLISQVIAWRNIFAHKALALNDDGKLFLVYSDSNTKEKIYLFDKNLAKKITLLFQKIEELSKSIINIFEINSLVDK